LPDEALVHIADANRTTQTRQEVVKRNRKFAVVLVTAPDLRAGRKLAKAALATRLVACANLVPGIESHYWWQGKIETGPEILIIFKTTTKRLAALEHLIISKHPYDTPEFVVLSITAGNERYLDWLERALSKQ
jgi:periplasmic divalent cation tolerance protein